MIWLYRLLFPLFLVVSAPHYLARMRRRGGYADGFWHRFGRPPRLPARRPGARRIWIQAVSVGEMLAVGRLLEALKADGVEVVLTTTTSTGYRIARDRYGSLVAAVAYFPIDWLPFSAPAWRRIDPTLAIVAEGERWPEHLRQARARGVRVLCINARISDRSYRRLGRFRPAAAFVLGGVDRYLACSAQDASRFLELGCPSDRVETVGNLKLDVRIGRLDDADRLRLKSELGLPEGVPVVLGSSTWPGEEAALLDAFLSQRASGHAFALLLVPRHAERRAEIGALIRERNLSFHLRSEGIARDPFDVSVADTTGELQRLTQLADLVFVGKSLAPHTEGQTPVEAAVLGRPIVMGTGMTNFREIARDLVKVGAAVKVADSADLARRIGALLANRATRASMSVAASAWGVESGGAVERTLSAIRDELARTG